MQTQLLTKARVKFKYELIIFYFIEWNTINNEK